MTICCAVKFEGKVVIASDSEITYDEYSKLTDVSGSPKIYQFKDCYVAISGMSPMGEALDIMQNDPDFMAGFNVKTRQDVRSFTEVLYATLKMVVDDSLTSGDIVQHAGMSIMATPTGIYSLWQDLSVLEHHNFVCVGAGGPSARAALEVLYEDLVKVQKAVVKGFYDTEERQWEVIERITTRAVNVAIKHNLGCGGKIEMFRVTPLPEEESPIEEKGFFRFKR